MRFLSRAAILIALAMPFAQPAAGADAALTAEIEAAIKALDDAFAARDKATITEMVTADHMGVSTYGGAQTTPEQFETLNDLQVRYVDISPISITALGPDAVLVTYENSYEGTFAGTPLPSRVFVSQIWLKQGGNWLQRLYQETPIAAH